jgi:hypothetical protein
VIIQKRKAVQHPHVPAVELIPPFTQKLIGAFEFVIEMQAAMRFAIARASLRQILRSRRRAYSIDKSHKEERKRKQE